MENFFDTFLTFVLLYKYVGLFIIAYVAAFIFPLPSGTTLAAAGAFASQGYFNFPVVLLVALAGNIAGDATGYLIARRYGERMLSSIGFAHALHSRQYLFVNKYLQTFPRSITFFSRFFTQVNALVNILAGVGNMSWKTFFIFEVLGEVAFVFFYGYAGFFLGAQWEENFGLITDGVLAIILLGLIIIVARTVLIRKGNTHK